jgi:hypothetical protein
MAAQAPASDFEVVDQPRAAQARGSQHDQGGRFVVGLRL